MNESLQAVHERGLSYTSQSQFLKCITHRVTVFTYIAWSLNAHQTAMNVNVGYSFPRWQFFIGNFMPNAISSDYWSPVHKKWIFMCVLLVWKRVLYNIPVRILRTLQILRLDNILRCQASKTINTWRIQILNILFVYSSRNDLQFFRLQSSALRNLLKLRHQRVTSEVRARIEKYIDKLNRNKITRLSQNALIEQISFVKRSTLLLNRILGWMGGGGVCNSRLTFGDLRVAGIFIDYD